MLLINEDVNEVEAKIALETLLAGFEIDVKKDTVNDVYLVTLTKEGTSYYLKLNVHFSKTSILDYLNLLLDDDDDNGDGNGDGNGNSNVTTSNKTNPSIVTGFAGGLILVSAGIGFILVGTKMRKKKSE